MIDSLHIIGSRQIGGAERFLMRLTGALNEQNHRAAAMIRPNSPLRNALNHNIQQAHVPMRNGWDIFSLRAIQRFIRRERPPIVQTYMGRATRLTRLPMESGSIHVARLGGYYKIKGYYEHAHAWVGNTTGLCDYLISNGLPEDRVYCIGNFVEIEQPTPAEELDRLRKKLSIPRQTLILFSMGRFNHQKGFEDLIEAFAQLPTEINGRPLLLMIAGDGPLQHKLHGLARNLGIRQNIRWLGWQDRPGIYLDLADIFICSSRHETLGNVILEAWAHNLPVISTTAPGPVELIKNGQNGLLAGLRDPVDLASTTRDLLDGGVELWNRLAKSGLETLKSEHSREAIVDKYLQMYDELQKKLN
ncbi:MAG: glycosyltransferase [Desulfatiglandaceae bacterium]|jgi:L-malate glycosyltransferase